MLVESNILDGGVSGGGSGGAGGAQAPSTAVISMKPPLSPSYKFEKEEGGEGLEEEEGEAAPPAVIPGSATGYQDVHIHLLQETAS